MKKIAQEICNQLHDYHSFDGFKFTPNHVLDWGSQFNTSDQPFILDEFLHLLNQGIYISEENAKELLVRALKHFTKYFEFTKVSDFLKHVEFLKLQKPGKSQSVLLKMVDDLLKDKCGIGIESF